MAAGVRGEAKNLSRLSEASQFFNHEDTDTMVASGEYTAEDSTTEKVIDLLNQAQLEKEGKLNCLKQVQEFIVNKDPSLLDNFLDEILVFQQDKSADVRKFVVGFIEEACKKDVELLGKVLGNLVFMLNDDNVAVQKRVMLCITQLYKYALQDSESTKKGEADFSLDVIPRNHPLVRMPELREEGGTTLEALLTLIASPTISRAENEASAANKKSKMLDADDPDVISMSTAEAIDLTAQDLIPLLDKDNVTNLVLISMLSLPDNLPTNFSDTYTPIAAAGGQAQVAHLARLLASQMTTVGVGVGFERMDALKKAQDPRLKGKNESIQSIPVIGANWSVDADMENSVEKKDSALQRILSEYRCDHFTTDNEHTTIIINHHHHHHHHSCHHYKSSSPCIISITIILITITIANLVTTIIIITTIAAITINHHHHA
ncbi:hypothetical protein QZH41_004197 [Actinostola sp. cb2023]|nr:hypothetical protein QZH41_004197 [Actinostola sp. cb2023]